MLLPSTGLHVEPPVTSAQPGAAGAAAQRMDVLSTGVEAAAAWAVAVSWCSGGTAVAGLHVAGLGHAACLAAAVAVE